MGDARKEKKRTTLHRTEASEGLKQATHAWRAYLLNTFKFIRDTTIMDLTLFRSKPCHVHVPFTRLGGVVENEMQLSFTRAHPKGLGAKLCLGVKLS